MSYGNLPPSGAGAVMAWIPAAARGLPTSSAARSVVMRSRLFRKYVALFVAVVCVALLTNGLSEIWFSYQRAQGFAHPHPARAGRGCSRQDRPVRQGDRGSDRLDHADAWSRRAPSSSGGSTVCVCCARCRRSPNSRSSTPMGASKLRVSRLASGCGRQQHRLFQRSQIRQRDGEQGLLRPGLFSPRIRTLHDALARRRRPRRRRERRRGQPQVHLGRGLADQGRRGGTAPMSSIRRAG